jgi:hypothetical protein
MKESATLSAGIGGSELRNLCAHGGVVRSLSTAKELQHTHILVQPQLQKPYWETLLSNRGSGACDGLVVQQQPDCGASEALGAPAPTLW